MIDRRLKPTLRRLMDRNPAVVLIGPRQVGKTPLAQEVAAERDAVYVDLEQPSDLAKIKRSSAPQVSRGFRSACEDLRPTRRFVVHGGGESVPLAKDIRAMSLPAMVALAAGSR